VTQTDSLSDLLRGLTDGPAGPIRVREMVDHFGHRAFGAMLFAFSVPNLLPLPPGSSAVLGLPLVLLAPQLALGVKSPWLPRFAAERTVDRQALARGFSRIIPRLEQLERLLTPRLPFLFGPVGDRLIGLVCFILALVLVLPIPLGNMAPAGAIAALSLGLTQRDGALVLFGYLLACLSVGLLALSAHAAMVAIRHLIPILGV
jgi:hypothetical protein